LHQRPVDADRHRQARDDGLGARFAGRGADLGGEFVDVVSYERLCVALPVALQHALHAEQENGGGGQCQQQEERDQAPLERMAPAMARGVPAVAVFHAATRSGVGWRIDWLPFALSSSKRNAGSSRRSKAKPHHTRTPAKV
jgi:hypothetical protein